MASSAAVFSSLDTSPVKPSLADEQELGGQALVQMRGLPQRDHPLERLQESAELLTLTPARNLE